MTAGRNIKIRIAVAVAIDTTGRWAASGASALSDEYCQIITAECVGREHARYFVEVWVEVPGVVEPEKLEGTTVHA
jgi:hypothetical protein